VSNSSSSRRYRCSNVILCVEQLLLRIRFWLLASLLAAACSQRLGSLSRADALPYPRTNITCINAVFEQNMLSVARDDSYLNDTVAAVWPELQIASKEYDVTLSLERKFKMDTIVTKTKEDIDSYISLSHYLYNA